ncbi:MAG: galactosyldiacylglycerol synthase [Planctomycetes bacterium]|nr:galactosyldiacylglycerol synthase [Planctomycetota bacterium]
MAIRMTTLVLLSVSAGAGHVRAAQALQAWCERDHPGVTAVHLDVMDFVPKLFRRIYADSYVTLVERAPSLWGYLYGATDRMDGDARRTRIRQMIERLNTRRLVKRLGELAPDHVVCTHFLPAQLLSRLRARGEFSAPTWVQVTDFDVHQLWIHRHLDGYFAADDEVAFRMRDRGLAVADVHVTGIPIMPAFAVQLDRAQCAREIGVDPQRPTILMMSGGMGVGAIDRLAERVLVACPQAQVIALAGRNAALLARLTTLAEAHGGRLRPLGFTKTIERVMACADLAVTKPGGLTSAECLAVGLPMVVISPIPGQEERNADFLLERGAALKAYDAAGLEFRVRALMDDRERLARMRQAALAVGRPQAARDVLRRVLGATAQGRA